MISPDLRNAVIRLEEKLAQQRDILTQLSASVKSDRRLSLSQSIGNFTTGVTSFSLRCTRRWNQEIQAICDDAQLNAFQKRTAVNSLLDEFGVSAKKVLQVFLDKYLSDNPSDSESIQLANADDIAAGASLTIALSDEEKAFSKEVKEKSLFFSQVLLLFPRRPFVHVFPQAVAHYRGRTALITMDLPALGATETIQSLPEFKTTMELVSESLNMTSYFRTLDNGQEVLMWGPVEATLRLCIDGRYYIDTIGRLLPPFPPAPKTLLSESHVLSLRREAVLAFSSQLSPAAFQVFGSRDSAQRSRMVKHCAKLLCHDQIPKLVEKFVKKPPSTPKELIAQIHDAGVNIGLLAIVFSHVPPTAEELRSLIMTEMAARAARDHIRSLMLSRMDRLEVFECISEFVATMCNSETLPFSWTDDIVRRMKSKFAGFASLLIPVPSHTLLNLKMWLPRVAELLKVTFADGVTHAGSSPFHFSIVTVDADVKTYPLPDFVLCNMKCLEGGELSPKPPAHFELTMRPMEKLLIQRIAVLGNPVADDELAKFFASAKSCVSGFSYGQTLFDIASVMQSKNIPEASVYLANAIEILSPVEESITLGTALVHFGLAAVGTASFGDALKHISHGMNIIERMQLQKATQVDKSKRSSELDDDETFKGPLHSVFLTETSVQLAALYEQKGLFEEAEPLYRKVLESTIALFGPEDKRVSSALNDLAINLFQQQMYTEAEEFFKEDLTLTEKLCGADSPEVAASLNNLAALYDASDRSDEAEPLYRRDLQITIRSLGEEHANVATSRNNLATCLKKLGRYEESTKEYSSALAIRQKCFGEKHVSVAQVLTNIGALLVSSGNHAEARKHFLRALEIYDERVGKLHHSSKQCLDHLSELCHSMGLTEEAEAYSDRLMDIKRAESEFSTVQQAAVKIGQVQ